MVRKSSVASILRIASRHVAANAIALPIRVRAWKLLHMAGKAFGPEVLNWYGRVAVRVMASATPEPTVTLLCTNTSRQLLDVADYLESFPFRTARRDVAIGREHAFQRLSWPEIGERLPGIEHSSNAQQVALLANTVACHRLELCRIDDRSGSRIVEVSLG